MKSNNILDHNADLNKLCETARHLIACGDFDRCNDLVLQAMKDYPDAPQPHNLLGILREHEGEHLSAMRHFRAARELDPTYTPASQNLNTYGTFYSWGKCAFDENDCTSA